MAKIVEHYSLKQTTFSRCPVDIIIPYHAQYDKVVRLLNSIIVSTKSNPYQITLVDDASPFVLAEEFKDFDKKRPAGTDSIVKFVRSDHKLGFGEAIKMGLAYTSQPYVMIMHSDVVVEDPMWMIEMGRSLLNLRSKNVKMVGARTSNVSEGADSRVWGKKGEKIDDVILENTFLPFHCVLTYRALFKKIGFIKSYPYTSYEDEEYSHRMGVFGYKQAICGKSWVRHDLHGTIGPLMKDQSVREEIEKNRDRCIADLQLLYSKRV